MITESNYFERSFAQFHVVYQTPIRKPDYTSYTRDGEVSSEYWYTEKGLFRRSAHWGRVRHCRWYLNERFPKRYLGRRVTAFTTWKSMSRIQSIESYELRILKDNMSCRDLNRLVFRTSLGDFKTTEAYGACYFLQDGVTYPDIISYSKIKLLIL